MKSKLVITAVLIALSFALSAQDKNVDTKKKKEEVTFIVGMHCQACKERIEKTIPMERGVKDINVDLKKKEVTIIYNPQKTTVEKIKQAIVELGYSCYEKLKETTNSESK